MDGNLIRVAILDDHQGIIDGYVYRLAQAEDICVAATMQNGEELEAVVEANHVDVLLLDVEAPTSVDNPNPYPILFMIARLLDQYPEMTVLVISMHMERILVKKVVEAGASGYILKDDRAAIVDLPSIIRAVNEGGVYFSKQVAEMLLKPHAGGSDQMLSPRQTEALSLCAAHPEYTTEQIAHQMKVANSTVRNLLSGAYLRMGVPNRSAAIARARQMGLII
jgi:two-component system, NarL family, nitrate/nitrite response regulator NarL